MSDEALLKKNIDLFLKRSPHAAKIFPLKEERIWQSVHTKQKEDNLFNQSEGRFLHDQNGALDEAKKVIEELRAQRLYTLIFYGLGLGYLYEALIPWLKENPSHKVIFLEDDEEVLNCFLKRDLAKRLLLDEKALLVYINEKKDWRLYFAELLSSCPEISFFAKKPLIRALPSYETYKKSFFESIKVHAAVVIDRIFSYAYEQLASEEVLKAPLKNLLERTHAMWGLGFPESFKGKPAIICGAGASIEKYLPILKNSEQEALIFAGGTAINVLAANEIRPHLTFGVDPTPIHYSKIFHETAYEVPYFYMDRVHGEILKWVQAPKVYLGTLFKNDNSIPTIWADKALGLEGNLENAGVSITTTAIATAHYLGCNPIILAGVDLCHNQNRRYAKGMESHPLLGALEINRVDPPQTLTVTDVTGKKVTTTSQYGFERRWISDFAQNHSEIRIYNASDEGLSIPGVDFLDLREFLSESNLNKQDDLVGRLHTEIFQQQIYSATEERIHELLKEFKEGALRVDQFLEKIQLAIDKIRKSSSEALKAENLANIKFWDVEIIQESAYKYLLELFDDYYKKCMELQSCYWSSREGDLDHLKEELDIREMRARFCRTRLASWFEMWKNFVIEESPCPYIRSSAIPLEAPQIPNFDEKHTFKEYYPGGILKAQMSKKGSFLHGPQLFLNKNGQPMALSHFIEGKKEGDAFLWYASGVLFAKENYLSSHFNGEQLYYYEDGSIRSKISYKDGKLHGKVLHYHLNGQLKRELSFENGLREGLERAWDKKGSLYLEVRYVGDKPTGIGSLYWLKNGKKNLEVEFDPPGVLKWKKEWDKNGLMK